MAERALKLSEVCVLLGSLVTAVLFGFIAYKGPELIPDYVDHPTDEAQFLDRAYNEFDMDINTKFIFFFSHLVKKEKSGTNIAEYLTSLVDKHNEQARKILGDAWSYDPQERYEMAKRRIENAKTDEEKMEEKLRALQAVLSERTFHLHNFIIKYANDPDSISASELDEAQAKFEKKLKDVDMNVEEKIWSATTPGLALECLSPHPKAEDLMNIYYKVIHLKLKKCMGTTVMTYLTEEQQHDRQMLLGVFAGIVSFIVALLVIGSVVGSKDESYLKKSQ
ncbi:hypothetical protein QR680_003565 [Steinernema hermaphroditum]|uniref:Uncharacterized protein n=1 Tax=Steinernema hermaphroditum TaxID=289476 RepID=A0AA39HLU8_9BILA|nr:hypothetical protein QR680_003565 [Steinernema hermaphroditum]